MYPMMSMVRDQEREGEDSPWTLSASDPWADWVLPAFLDSVRLLRGGRDPCCCWDGAAGRMSA